MMEILDTTAGRVGSLLLLGLLATWVFWGGRERLFPGDRWWVIGLKIVGVVMLLAAVAVLGPMFGGAP